MSARLVNTQCPCWAWGLVPAQGVPARTPWQCLSHPSHLSGRRSPVIPICTSPLRAGMSGPQGPDHPKAQAGGKEHLVTFPLNCGGRGLLEPPGAAHSGTKNSLFRSCPAPGGILRADCGLCHTVFLMPRPVLISQVLKCPGKA